MLKVAEVEACLAAGLQEPMASHGVRYLKRDCRFVHEDPVASWGFGLSVTRGGPRRACNVSGYLHVRLEEVEALIARHTPNGDKKPDPMSATLWTRLHNPIPNEVYEGINFRVTSQQECDWLGPKLYELFVTYGIPWLEAHRSYDHVEKIILAGPPGAVPINSRWKADAVQLAIYVLQGRPADYDEYAEVSIAGLHDMERKGRLKYHPRFLPIDAYEQLIENMRTELAGAA